MGRSQGVLIFWGLVSTVFAGLFCFYFWKNHENESTANKLRDEVINLQDDRDALNSQKEKLQASMSEQENSMKTREDFLQDKEAKLAAEESRIEAQGQQTQPQSQPSAPQAPMVKKFGDVIHKLTKTPDDDIVTRNGRPVLRLPNTALFASGDSILKPEGKILLAQITQAFAGQEDHFELRIATYTDTDPEPFKSEAAKPSNVQKKDKNDIDTKPRYDNAWELTAARAAALTSYFHDQDTLPFANVIIIPRGDTDPVVTGAKDDHSRNRRLEITFAPTPAAYHADASATSLAPPPDTPPPAKKDKDKDKAKKTN